MTWKDRIAIVDQKLATENTHQAPEDWPETEKIRWLEELETMENEHHVILYEISMELDPMQHRENNLDTTNPSLLMRLEASGQRPEEINTIKQQQRQIMRAEKKIIW